MVKTGRQKLALKSSIVGISSQCIIIVLSFVCTRYFVRYIGLDAQGLNGIIGNMLGLLQLSELGIGTAITYALYEPIAKGDRREICIIMRLFRKAYWIIGSIVAIAGIVMSFFIDYFTKTSVFDKGYVLVAYYILLFNTVCTYFLAYKRNLLYADQQQYRITEIDTIFNVIASLLKLIVILEFKSYHLYLLISIIQTIGSNLVISHICDKRYPYIKEKVTDAYSKMDELKKNVCNLIVGKFGGFVYSSTDNLIISLFSGLASVGLITNYKTIMMVLSNLAGSITGPIRPMVGNYIREVEEKEKSYDLFLSYSYVLFFIASIIMTGITSGTSYFIRLWLGNEYVLPVTIVILLGLDVYLGIMQQACVDFINVLGYFQYDKYMSILGAGINLATSIAFAKYVGIAGVLIGTLITQIFYWIFRIVIVFRSFFKKGLGKYLTKLVIYTTALVAELAIILLVFNKVNQERYTIYGFVFLCIFVVVICVAINLLISIRTKEQKFLWSIIGHIFPRRNTGNVK